MTPQPSIDYDTLPAGRELDALVAERVMGWEWLERRMDVHDPSTARKALFPPSDSEWIRINYNERDWSAASSATPRFHDWDEAALRSKGGAAELCLPYYSSDIAAAWQVVEKMAEKGDLIFLQTHRGDDEQYAATFVEPFTAYAPTVPLAVCRAALKAVSV